MQNDRKLKLVTWKNLVGTEISALRVVQMPVG